MTAWPQIRARSFDGTFGGPRTTANPLSCNEQGQIRRMSSVLDFRRGEIVFAEGDEARFVYFVDSGVIRISRCAENGQRQILAFRAPGDLFGLPDAGRYINSAEAVCAARIYGLAWNRMQQMMREEPQLQMNLLMKVVCNFRQAQERIMTLGQQNIYQRLATFLLDFLRVPEFFDEERALLNLPVNRFDLADYLGTVPQSAARAFTILEDRGLVRRVTSRTIEILDIAGLQLLQRGPRRGHSGGIPDEKQSSIQEQCG